PRPGGACEGRGAAGGVCGEGEPGARGIFEDWRSGAGDGFAAAGRGAGRSGRLDAGIGYAGARIFVSLGGAAGYADESAAGADGGRDCESMAGARAGQSSLPEGGGDGFTQNRQEHCARAADPRYGAPGNGCGRGPQSKGKAETASRDKNVSGAADSGESRRGGTRAVSFADPCHYESGRTMGGFELPLAGRPAGKRAFQELARRGQFRVLTKKVIRPGEREIAANPR